jgi:lysosomal-associated membrane protein 1/2
VRKKSHIKTVYYRYFETVFVFFVKARISKKNYIFGQKKIHSKMKFVTLLAIFSLFIVGIYAADDLPIAAATSDIPTVDEKKQTTKTTPAATSTSEVTTTSTSSTTTSTAPTTTASTTTTTPQTTSSTTTTTTISTTTEVPITTTPAPKPEKPQVAKYYVRENNITCILVEFAAQLNISYGINETKKFVSFNWPSPGEQPVETVGSCGNETTEQNIIIIWKSGNEDVNTLNLTFSLNSTTKPKEYSLSFAVFNLSSSIVPGSSDHAYYHVGGFFEIPKSRAYHCTTDQTLNLTAGVDPKSEIVGNVTLSRVLMETYRSNDNKNFSEAIDCGAINTPDIVPIAVGIALIALVVVVLIAYLVGRRRAQSRGYVSM